MTSGRPLHELLADLVGDADAARAHGDPETYLAANGHPGLPPDLVAEAVVSYADTAPVDVAEHLAPYVTTHSAVPTSEPAADDWFGLITTAPAEDLPDDLADDPGFADDLSGEQPWSPDQDHDHASALDFGAGSEGLDSPHHVAADDSSDDDTRDDTPDDSPDAADEQADLPPEQSAWTDLEPETAGLDDLDGDLDDDPDDL
jgi:hypothetical protein